MDREEVVSVASPEDVLAYVPHFLGYWPQHSLVVLALRGKQLGASLRLDLPDRSASFPEQIRYARNVAGHLSVDGRADGALLAVYAGIDWRDAADPGYDRLMFCLAQSLASAGLPVREAWWVGETRWRDYLCRDASCCPFDGHSLKTVLNSALSAELVFRGSCYEPDLAAAMELPETTPARRAAGRAAFEAARVGVPSGQPDAAELDRALRHWDAALSTAGSVRDDSEPEAAVPDTAVPDAVRPDAAASGMPGTGTSAGDLGQAGRLAAWLCNPHLRDAILVLALADCGRAAEKCAAELLLGSPELVPDWPRLARLEVILHQIVALHGINALHGMAGPGEADAEESCSGPTLRDAAAAALTGLGWLEWCRGRGSRAGAYLDAALALQPDYRLAKLFLQLIESGLLCSWAKNEATAWQRGPEAA